MSGRACETCGNDVAERGATKCARCRAREARNEALDERFRQQYDPKYTLPMFSEEEK